MRIARQLGLLACLVMVAAVLVWTRRPLQKRTAKPAVQPIVDLQATNPLNQAGGGPAPAEAYAVYSSLYRAAMNEPLAFLEDSQTDVPQVGQSCLKPKTPEEQEMAGAFEAANQRSHRWEPKFSIAPGYRLLSGTEASQAMMCLAEQMRDTSQCASYRQLRYVRLLGIPGFNPAHTRALVSVLKKCGGFCGTGGIFEVEKAGDSWQRSPQTDFTRNCSWMY